LKKSDEAKKVTRHLFTVRFAFLSQFSIFSGQAYFHYNIMYVLRIQAFSAVDNEGGRRVGFGA